VNVTANARIDITNTTINKVADGLSMTNNAGIMQGTLTNSRIYNTSNAAVNLLSGSLSINNSVITDNTSFGIIAQGGALINVANSLVSHNVTGFSTNNGAANIRLSGNTITNNTSAFVITAGTIATYQNNTVTAGQGAGTTNSNLTQQ
jgi:hypothetical protein